jgi:hypothetical protein
MSRAVIMKLCVAAETLDRVDMLAQRVGVNRRALLRALITLSLNRQPQAIDLAALLVSDPVRPGRRNVKP